MTATMMAIGEEEPNAVPGIDSDPDDSEPWGANLSFPELMDLARTIKNKRSKRKLEMSSVRRMGGAAQSHLVEGMTALSFTMSGFGGARREAIAPLVSGMTLRSTGGLKQFFCLSQGRSRSSCTMPTSTHCDNCVLPLRRTLWKRARTSTWYWLEPPSKWQAPFTHALPIEESDSPKGRARSTQPLAHTQGVGCPWFRFLSLGLRNKSL